MCFTDHYQTTLMNKKELIIVLSLTIPLFLLLFSYKSVLSFADFTPAQENVFGFLEGRQKLAPGFTELEISHLEDVQKVMKTADYIFFILLLMITAIITYYKKDTDFLLKILKLGGKITAISVLSLGLLSTLFFNFMFTIFHNLFFPQGNWVFASDSLIIQTFPLDFFIVTSQKIFLLTLFLGIIFIVSDYLYQYVLRDRN